MKKSIFQDYIIDSNGKIYNKKNNLLKGFKVHGFIVLDIKKKNYYLHKLIAETFIPGYDQENDLIDFKDNDKNNCSIDNLIIKKNARLKNPIRSKEMTSLFESFRPYELVGFFIKRFLNKYFVYSNSFDYEDLKQLLVMHLWSRFPNYYYHKKDKIQYSTHAIERLKSYIKGSEFWQYVTSNYNQVNLQNESFEYESLGLTITQKEYYKIHLGEE